MPNAKRRVTVRRAEVGSNDPIQKARQAGIQEGRELARAEHKKAEAAVVARIKADERAIRDEVIQRMEKEIDDLTERCRVLESRPDQTAQEPPRRGGPWVKKESNEWIAQFDEEEEGIVRRSGPMGRS